MATKDNEQPSMAVQWHWLGAQSVPFVLAAIPLKMIHAEFCEACYEESWIFRNGGE